MIQWQDHRNSYIHDELALDESYCRKHMEELLRLRDARELGDVSEWGLRGRESKGRGCRGW